MVVPRGRPPFSLPPRVRAERHGSYERTVWLTRETSEGREAPQLNPAPGTRWIYNSRFLNESGSEARS